MNDDYLWDGSGTPDPEIEHLEAALQPLRHSGRPPRTTRRAPVRWGAAAAAAAVLLAVAAWQLVPRPGVSATSWQIAGSKTPLYAGQVLRTGEAGLRLEADDLGEVELAADSELRIATRRRLLLPRGRIHVLIWAPPRQFVVDTPSARAVDLGCQYTLSVDPTGNGVVEVETGWVAFQYQGRESFIPAGALCRTRRGRGPGTPYYADADAGFRAALASFDDNRDAAALERVLALARPRDGLTLWHLLESVSDSRRGEVFDRFASLVPLPAGVTRAGVVARDPRMLDLCWGALNLDSAEWWRQWKRPW